jgi:hypothetical protein
MILELETASGDLKPISVKERLAETAETISHIASQQRQMNRHITRASLAKHIAECQPVTMQTAVYFLKKLEY